MDTEEDVSKEDLLLVLTYLEDEIKPGVRYYHISPDYPYEKDVRLVQEDPRLKEIFRKAEHNSQYQSLCARIECCTRVIYLCSLIRKIKLAEVDSYLKDEIKNLYHIIRESKPVPERWFNSAFLYSNRVYDADKVKECFSSFTHLIDWWERRNSPPTKYELDSLQENLLEAWENTVCRMEHVCREELYPSTFWVYCYFCQTNNQFYEKYGRNQVCPNSSKHGRYAPTIGYLEPYKSPFDERRPPHEERGPLCKNVWGNR